MGPARLCAHLRRIPPWEFVSLVCRGPPSPGHLCINISHDCSQKSHAAARVTHSPVPNDLQIYRTHRTPSLGSLLLPEVVQSSREALLQTGQDKLSYERVVVISVCTVYRNSAKNVQHPAHRKWTTLFSICITCTWYAFMSIVS